MGLIGGSFHMRFTYRSGAPGKNVEAGRTGGVTSAASKKNSEATSKEQKPNPMSWFIAMNIFKKPGLEERRDYEDRRDQLYNLDYFSNGGIERRSGKDRRILKGDRQPG